VAGEVKTEGWYTQFAVQVVDNVKGNLQGTVNVGVTGGYRDGVFYVAKGNTWLAPGSTYLFATRYNGENGSYRLIRFDTPVSWKLLSEDSTLTTTQLQAIAQGDPRVKQLEAAYPNERLDPADVAGHIAWNSYQSLHPILPPPVITVQDSAPTVSSLTSIAGSTSTTMTWITNKPATSQLSFGSTTAMGESTTPDTALVTNHAMVTSGLTPGTTYYYEVQSKDASGTISTSAQQSFVFGGQGNATQSLGGN
jgi:hypothetical protein